LEVKRQGREADHSPPIGEEVKKTWIRISTPPNIFMGRCLVKHRNNLTFLCKVLKQLVMEYKPSLADCTLYGTVMLTEERQVYFAN
jgi:hypothetical protein